MDLKGIRMRYLSAGVERVDPRDVEPPTEYQFQLMLDYCAQYQTYPPPPPVTLPDWAIRVVSREVITLPAVGTTRRGPNEEPPRTLPSATADDREMENVD